MLHSVLRPSRRHFVVAFAILACGLGRFGGAAWAGEVKDEPETVAPVEFGAAKPVKPLDSLAVAAPGSLAVVVPNSSKVVSPNSLTFVAPSKSELVGAVGFNLSNVARDVALEQIKAGTLTPEAAWQSGALTFDNIADLLEHPADPWIINERRTDNGLHHQLIALLLQHGGTRLEDLPKVPQRTRLWLADYYQSHDDERCLLYAQSIIDERKEPIPKGDPILIQAIERIAYFYEQHGQHQKAAEVWLLVGKYLEHTDWWYSESTLQNITQQLLADPSGQAFMLPLKKSLIELPDIAPTILNGVVSLMLNEGEFKRVDELLNDDTVAKNPLPALRALGISLQGKVNLLQGSKSQAAELWGKAQTLSENAAPSDPEWMWCRENTREGLETLDLFGDKSFYLSKTTLFAKPEQSPVAEFEVLALQPIEISVKASSDKVRVVSGDWQIKIASFVYSKKVEIYFDSPFEANDLSLSLQELPGGQVEKVFIEVPEEMDASEDIDLW